MDPQIRVLRQLNRLVIVVGVSNGLPEAPIEGIFLMGTQVSKFSRPGANAKFLPAP